MIRRNRDVSRPNVNQTSSQFATVRTPNLKNKLAHAARVMAPTLFALTFASVAHAQGTMDFSGAQTLMGTFKTFAIYAGAVICFGGLIFAGIRMMSGRFQDAIPGLFGALFGAGVLGWGAGWILNAFDGGSEAAVAAMAKSPVIGRDEVKEAIRYLRKNFQSIDHRGPAQYARFEASEGTEEERVALRRYAHGTLQEFFRHWSALGIE